MQMLFVFSPLFLQPPVVFIGDSLSRQFKLKTKWRRLLPLRVPPLLMKIIIIIIIIILGLVVCLCVCEFSRGNCHYQIDHICNGNCCRLALRPCAKSVHLQ